MQPLNEKYDSLAESNFSTAPSDIECDFSAVRNLRILVQPQIDMEKGGVCGAEILIRGCTTEDQEMSPLDIVKKYREEGRSIDLLEFVLAESMEVIKSPEFMRRKIPLSINCPSDLLLEKKTLNAFIRIAQDQSFSEGKIIIELTEEIIVPDSPVLFSSLEKIRSLGFRTSLDDFGVLGSNFSRLAAHSFDQIKIDKAIVSRISHERSCQIIFASIIRIGRKLGAQIVAEGIENYATAVEAQRLGCRVGQGYLFSPPLEKSIFLANL